LNGLITGRNRGKFQLLGLQHIDNRLGWERSARAGQGQVPEGDLREPCNTPRRSNPEAAEKAGEVKL
jgi:hypothetical protein